MNHKISEQENRIERREQWDTEFGNYECLIIRDTHRTELSIYPKNSGYVRMGIIKCMPKSVADIEKFAGGAGELFRHIAEEMRKEGMDDLRSKQERLFDEIDSRFRRGL